MNGFYERAERLFKDRDTSRLQFTKAIGMPYSSLSAYWRSEKMPPGDVLVKLAEYLRVDLDYLVYGRNDPLKSSKALRQLTEFASRYSDEQILEIFGAIKQYVLMSQMISHKKE